MNICITGTGYVGLVTATCFAEMGNTVCCVDVNPAVVDTLNQGKIHIYKCWGACPLLSISTHLYC